MPWLSICGELRWSSSSVQWEPMFVLYCQRSVTEDYRLELDSLGTRHVPAKMAEFFHEIQRKYCEIVDKLQILATEMELNARKKNLFIEKLNGLILY
nr:hypothetical protein [Tanacetum cinerariifolium]